MYFDDVISNKYLMQKKFIIIVKTHKFYSCKCYVVFHIEKVNIFRYSCDINSWNFTLLTLGTSLHCTFVPVPPRVVDGSTATLRLDRLGDGSHWDRRAVCGLIPFPLDGSWTSRGCQESGYLHNIVRLRRSSSRSVVSHRTSDLPGASMFSHPTRSYGLPTGVGGGSFHNYSFLCGRRNSCRKSVFNPLDNGNFSLF